MKLRIFIMIAALSLTVSAVGPIKKVHWVTWTPSPSVGVTGYWLYWRVAPAAYSDTNRVAVGTNVVMFDLLNLHLPAALYTLAMSATNALGEESILSNEATWDSGPKGPTINGVTQ